MKAQPNLGKLLLEGFRWFDDALRARMKVRLGLSVTPIQSLLIADLAPGGSRQADIARTMGISRQAVNETVRRLEAQGMVEIAPDPDNGRSKIVRLTRLGKRSVAVARETFAELEYTLQNRIGQAGLDDLRSALEADWGEPPVSPHRQLGESVK